MFLSSIGLISGTVQLFKRKKTLCVFFCLLEFVIIGIINVGLIVGYNKEEIVVRNDKKMIKETHSVLLFNWIKYYDYKNIFVKNKQEKIYEAYDDSIEEYLYTIYYDEGGNIITP